MPKEDSNMQKSNLGEMIFLSQEANQNKEIEALVMSVTDSGSPVTVRETNEKIHGLHKYVSNDQLHRPFAEFASAMMTTERRHDLNVWIAHVTDSDATARNPSFHEGAFTFAAWQCCEGYFRDPFSFGVETSWENSEYEDICVKFDFDRNMMRVTFRRWQNTLTWNLEISFREIKKAFLVQPEIRDGQMSYSLYMYLCCVPEFWKSEPRERIINIPGVSENVVGQCSALKLDLINVSDSEFGALVDKLNVCGFDVWWTALRTTRARNHIIVDENVPWSVLWLLSEGYRINGQLSSGDVDLLSDHRDVLYRALKGVLSHEIIVYVMDELESFLRDQERSCLASSSPKLPSSYTLIRKVVVTPTRLLFLPPEPVETNEVLRKYDASNFIMALFRDENLERLDSANSLAIRERIERFLSDGLKAEGRTYAFVGCSSSELRQHSCWMYADDGENEITVDDVWNWIGQLSDVSLASYVSRLSPSLNAVDLSEQNYKIIETTKVKRTGYCVTNGDGKMSTDVAEEVSRQCGLVRAPSAFEIRIGGFDGILVVDPRMPNGELHICSSMNNFDSLHRVLEVVDYTRPQRACLDRDLITVMSERGIADKVFLQLQDEYLHSLLDMFRSNEKAISELGCGRAVFELEEIRDGGVSLVSDPFFRSILLVRYKERLNDLLEKMRIPLPLDKGRVLMGVEDETGQLKNDEVFIQYSKDANHPKAETIVVKGSVLVTESRCLPGSDLCVFKAVDCPDLRHLVDCLVLPVEGKRRLATRMTRPDLESKLYWTTWHVDLVTLQNCEQDPRTSPTEAERKASSTRQEVMKYFAELATQSTRIPSFLETQPFYEGVLGELFYHASRVVQTVDLHLDSIRTLWQSDNEYAYKIRAECGDIATPEFYRKLAEIYYEDYETRMQHILDTYGMNDEIELFARIMKNEDIDESTLLLRSEINELKEVYIEIFETKDTSVDVHAKAWAWYNIAYRNGRFESFAWIASAVLASVVETGSKPLCKINDEQDSQVLDKEVESFLEVQATTTKGIVERINASLPSMQCSLEPIDLAKWHIPSHDIYIQMKHSDVKTIEKEFAELCSVVLELNEAETNMAYDNPGSYITKSEMAKKVVVDGQELTLHVYHDGTFATVLEEIVANATNGLVGKCLEIVCQFWMLFSKRALKRHVSAIHICELVLFSLKNHDTAVLLEALKEIFTMFADFDTLVEWQRNSRLCMLECEDLRFLQSVFFEGLQLLVISGTEFRVNHKSEVDNKYLLKTFAISTEALAYIEDGKEGILKRLAQQLGCSIRIRRFHDTFNVGVIEGFGTKEQLLELTDEIMHLENIIRTVVIPKMPFMDFERRPILEGSVSEDDKLVIIPYNKPSYMPRYYKKKTFFVEPGWRKKANEDEKLENIADSFCTIIDKIRPKYDELYHDCLRLVCRLTNFHFSKRDHHVLRTVGDFVKLLNRRTDRMATSHYPANVNQTAVMSVLQRHGMEVDKTATRSNIIMAQLEENGVKKQIVLNENMELVEVRKKLEFGTVEYLRNARSTWRTKGQKELTDFIIRLQGRHFLYESNDGSTVEFDEPVLSIDRDRPVKADDMPFLKVNPDFGGEVFFIRQRRINTYRFPTSVVAAKADHFTTHVKVEIAEVREYQLDKSAVNDFVNVVILLPTLPPLHCRDDHREMIKKVFRFAIEISNSVQ